MQSSGKGRQLVDRPTYGNESFMDGSSYYMSPEQVDSLPIDKQADIYGRGITAHEMVTGEKPFVSGDH